ncbi:threonine aldolase family protein [Cognatishimia maritima]|uniref:L-threonine aldolase n=1 Tax=Cognatishimia maritima TaxID=870908 RepID=A0A1M5LCE5_9RHOB|nr:GntG family PLP-dependent aldolase [Cognatishimia maritima]SHG62646.1 L-threonine aldolase [Cognatishimia maritima]
MNAFIDLSSDTCTRPGEAMRAAMARAEVGDESKHRDPTVTHLCERVADLLGQEAALFLPSGTMCNNIAAMVHCSPGSEVIAAEASHVETSESGALSVFAGARLRTIRTDAGVFTPAQVRDLMRSAKGTRAPRVSAIFAEQTHNRSGGSVWPAERIASLAAFAREHDIAFHIDGARIMNAAVALGCDASDFGRHTDSVWMSFTKGLGCPVGSVLAGSTGFIDAAWEWKHRFGGGMRQAGMLAAGCLHALDHNIDRLAEDHENAALLASRIARIDGLRLTQSAFETNMVFFELLDEAADTITLARKLESEGIRIGVESPRLLRAVTHMDVTARDIETAADALACLVTA